jgi:hypothetical protein
MFIVIIKYKNKLLAHAFWLLPGWRCLQSARLYNQKKEGKKYGAIYQSTNSIKGTKTDQVSHHGVMMTRLDIDIDDNFYNIVDQV